MKNHNGLMIANVVIAAFNWLVALPVLICNLFGLWDWWQLSDYAHIAIFAFPLLISLIMAIISITFSYRLHAKKRLALNITCLAISVSAVLFTFFVSITWFW